VTGWGPQTTFLWGSVAYASEERDIDRDCSALRYDLRGDLTQGRNFTEYE